MSNIDKRALREAAEKASTDNHTQDEWFHYLRCSTPETVLALLDELEAKDRSWAAQDDHINQQADQIESLEKKNGDLSRALGAAQKRIADYQELISGLVGVSSSILREVERINKAAGTTKGE